MLRFLVLALYIGCVAAATCDPNYTNGPDILCQCQEKYKDRSNPTYPMFPECAIPNSNDLVINFIEDDNTWCPEHEFGMDWSVTPDCTGPTTACKQTLETTDHKWICCYPTPKCCGDLPRVDGSVYPQPGGYGCGHPDKPVSLGTNCPIQCQPGFTKTGGPAQCQNVPGAGPQWTNYPTCKNAGCTGAPSDPMNGKFAANCSPAKNGDQCALTCDAGFAPSGPSECEKGKWSTETCVKVTPSDCHGDDLKVDPYKPPRGHYNCKEVPVGGTCPLHCPPGYSPKGEMPKCGPGPKWIVKNDHTAAHCACTPFSHIQANTPPACIFAGFTGVDRMDFVIDVSGSMNAKYNFGGQKMSRLDYIKKALNDALDGLAHTQSFNIITYNPKARGWKSGVVPATDANKAAAKSFVNGLRATGGTNIYDALSLAMKDPQVQGIFLLTDGSPTVGKKWPDIQTLGKQWAQGAGAGQTRKIMPIAFQAPGSSWTQMKILAKNTGGSAHQIV